MKHLTFRTGKNEPTFILSSIYTATIYRDIHYYNARSKERINICLP